MAKIDEMVKEFLAQQRIAVVGVSDRRETGCNSVYRKFKQAGYQVAAVNPRMATFEGDPCYPDLRTIPDAPQAVFILANPQVTDEIADQCIEAGVSYIWMHCMLGTKPGLAAGMTSVSQSAVDKCRQAGIEVIPGSCPNQFFEPDIFHGLMRVMWRGLGLLQVTGNGARKPAD
jgi:hypothetical protein